MSYERRPCPGAHDTPCRGDGVTRCDRPCATCRRVCECGSTKSPDKASCGCRRWLPAPVVRCLDCGTVKTAGGNRCATCARTAYRAQVEAHRGQTDGTVAVAVARRDHHDPTARVMALEYGYALGGGA